MGDTQFHFRIRKNPLSRSTHGRSHDHYNRTCPANLQVKLFNLYYWIKLVGLQFAESKKFVVCLVFILSVKKDLFVSVFRRMLDITMDSYTSVKQKTTQFVEAIFKRYYFRSSRTLFVTGICFINFAVE